MTDNRAGMASGYWQDLTTEDFARLDAAETLAVLPVAAIEQHGPHLPLATDALINEAIVAATLRRLAPRPTVLVLPAMTVGASLEHTAFAGTLDIDARTLLASWKAVGASVARAGIRKLVIFNSHGGQAALVDQAALQLRVELGMFVVRASYFSFGAPPGLFGAAELAPRAARRRGGNLADAAPAPGPGSAGSAARLHRLARRDGRGQRLAGGGGAGGFRLDEPGPQPGGGVRQRRQRRCAARRPRCWSTSPGVSPRC